ncbi:MULTISPECIES: PAS domain S-box protein [Trichocoleus]|uniref:histidine kinase n=1 Tax=Trichocoleus desertorum GB2-A4 TaxID=2933944 RepID=A0ABV0JAY9_9CYAN|nr:PAS domain S-box protein [Trichocoleus sp. FACHB-46]MBD1863195.1 PAS domain S-box protein [Trichocoleus sp. FACHB-46]
MARAKQLLQSEYSVAVLATLFALLLRFLLTPLLRENAPLLVFVLPVMFSAWYGGFRAGLLATGLCTLFGTYFFIPPYFSLQVTDAVNLTRISIFVFEGLFISWLSQSLRSARQRAEKAFAILKESEEQYRLLVEGVRDYAIFGLDANGYITSWNSGAEVLKGYKAAEVLGHHFSIFYPEAAIAQNKPAYGLQVAIAEGHYTDEGWRRRKDGSLFWASVVITALYDENQKLYGFSKVTRDITERRRSEQALQESYNLLERVIEETADAVFVKDLQGKYQLVNSATARVFGKPKTEILGKSDLELIPLKQAIALQKIDRSVIETGISQASEEPLLVAGEVRIFLTSKDPCRDAEGNIVGVIGVARDLTERIQAEMAQRQLLKDLSDVKFALDQAAILATTDSHGVITEVNDQFCQISQFSRAELIGQTHRLINSGYHSQEFFRQLWSTITQGEVWQGEIKNRAKDGTSYWVDTTIVPFLDESGKPLQYLAVRFDITTRKQAEAKLQRSIQRLEAVHQIDQAILSLEAPSAIAHSALSHLSNVLPCNQSAVVLFDIEAAELQILAGAIANDVAGTVLPIRDRFPIAMLWDREPIWYVQDLADLPQRSVGLEQILTAGYHSFLAIALTVENSVLGDLILLAQARDAFSAEDQQIAQEVASQLAIAIQQTRLRDQLQGYTNQLEQRVAERTTALEEAIDGLETFSYSVSHDLRAPLRSMQGLSQALLEDYGDRLDAIGQRYAQEISASAQQADQLVNDLLDYGRLSRAEIIVQPLNLTELVTTVVEKTEAEWQARPAMVTVDHPLPEVMGHRLTLIQALLNLLNNAVKFVPPDRQPQIHIWAELRSGWVRLWIEDNGIGIAPQYHERIFQAFERLHTRQAYPGTGVGLAIVRKGAERMRGRVGVESALGQGSRFWLELQAGEESSTAEP